MEHRLRRKNGMRVKTEPKDLVAEVGLLVPLVGETFKEAVPATATCFVRDS